MSENLQNTLEIEPQVSQLESKPNILQEESGGINAWLFFSSIFFITSIIFCIVGLVELVNPQDAKVLLGGDAYNYIIHSITSNGYLLISLVTAVLSVLSVLYAIFMRLKILLQINRLAMDFKNKN